jgi:hypothetical protein
MSNDKKTGSGSGKSKTAGRQPMKMVRVQPQKVTAPSAKRGPKK